MDNSKTEEELGGSINFEKNLKAVLLKADKEEVKISENFKTTKIKNNVPVSYREIDSRGRTVTSDTSKDQLVTSSIRTTIEYGENNVRKVAQILIEHFNGTNALWSFSINTLRDDEIDFFATDGFQILGAQVTRADRTNDLYRALSLNGEFNRISDVDNLIAIIKQSIDCKENIIPKLQRKSLMLVLDATDTPEISLNPVTSKFMQLYREWIDELGFHSIWIVGPTALLTVCLNKQASLP